MMTIVLASHNRNKAAEFQRLLGENYQAVTLPDVGFKGTIVEDGKTFRANALLKAKAARDFLDGVRRPYVVLAEDSGLCVEALPHQLGVKTARYGGEDLDDQGKRNLLREELRDQPNRNAMYKCVLVLTTADGRSYLAEGETHGTIIDEERGDHGFAFDSIFYSSDLQKTFAEAEPEEKDAVSHRARALEKLTVYLPDME